MTERGRLWIITAAAVLKHVIVEDMPALEWIEQRIDADLERMSRHADEVFDKR